jgi:hypothetical protein
LELLFSQRKEGKCPSRKSIQKFLRVKLGELSQKAAKIGGRQQIKWPSSEVIWGNEKRPSETLLPQSIEKAILVFCKQFMLHNQALEKFRVDHLSGESSETYCDDSALRHRDEWQNPPERLSVTLVKLLTDFP